MAYTNCGFCTGLVPLYGVESAHKLTTGGSTKFFCSAGHREAYLISTLAGHATALRGGEHANDNHEQ